MVLPAPPACAGGAGRTISFQVFMRRACSRAARTSLIELMCKFADSVHLLVWKHGSFQEQQLTVTVLEQTGKYYTTDHRRVWAVKSMCKKRGIAEEDFNLIVFLQSDASNRGQMQMNAKMTTVNDGVSVVVEKMNRKETIRKKYGETYNEYSLFSSDGVITNLETDEKYRRAVQTEYNLQQLEVRMNTHDNDFRKCVSIVADQRTLTVNGRALYDRLKNDCAGPGEQLFGSEAE